MSRDFEDIKRLQQKTLATLRDTNRLIEAVARLFESDSTRQKYADFFDQIHDEITTVKDLRLRMAIVAPMSAGKSTVINAVTGHKLLPFRNTAATTIPAEIFLRTDVIRPVLQIPGTTFRSAKRMLAKLKSHSKDDNAEEPESPDPHLQPLWVKIVKGQVALQNDITGYAEIYEALAELNDIIRLYVLLEQAQGNRARIDHLQPVEISIPINSRHSTFPSHIPGNLVLVDTPGPNAAGEYRSMGDVVSKQLSLKPLILLILDYTQLKTEAAEKLKKDVQKALRQRGNEYLYVLVNKIDTRMPEDNFPTERVVDFVQRNLELDSVISSERVFEVSALKAYLASNFLVEDRLTPNKDLLEMESAVSLARALHPLDWEDALRKFSKNKKNFRLEAEKLYEQSGFPRFLSKAIVELIHRVGPTCIDNALRVTEKALEHLSSDLRIRNQAVDKQSPRLNNEIKAISGALDELQDRQKVLRKATRKVKKDLYDDIKKRFQLLTDDISFPENELRRVAFFQFKGAQDKGSTRIRFDTKESLEEFRKHLNTFGQNEIDKLGERSRNEANESVRKSHSQLLSTLKKEIGPVVQQAKKRLGESLQVSIPLPLLITQIPQVELIQVEAEKEIIDGDEVESIVKQPIVVTKVRRVKNYWVNLGPFRFGEYETDEKYQDVEYRNQRVRTIQPKKTVHLIELDKYAEQFERFATDYLKRFYYEICNHIEGEFDRQVMSFVNAGEDYFHHYQSLLEQGLHDQKLSLKRKLQLKRTLESNATQVDSLRKKVELYGNSIWQRSTEGPLGARRSLIRVLFLASDPLDTNVRLNLGTEYQLIDDAIRMSKFRNRFQLHLGWNVPFDALQKNLLRYEPHIVHFSGHGSSAGELLLADDYGDSTPVTKETLAEMFSLLKDNINCVVLNSCYSENQARVIAEHIDFVVGMSSGIPDRVAIKFSEAFYQALGHGKDILSAFKLGRLQASRGNAEIDALFQLVAMRKAPDEFRFV